MESISILTINCGPEDANGLVEIVEDASCYFPRGMWESIGYIGKLRLHHDIKISVKDDVFGAFLFRALIGRIRKIKDSNRLKDLLLGITLDPIVDVYYGFEGRDFKRAAYLIHDYVSEKVGVVSLFWVNGKVSSKMVAHGLGHNRGLSHHLEPIDLMYTELLTQSILQVEGFCEKCLRKLAKGRTE